MRKGGIFLDRDGTINEEVNYLSSPEHIKLLPGSADAIHEANLLGFPVFVITNQSGIARGLFSEQQLQEIHQHLLSVLEQHDAHITAIYYCPHHPEWGSGANRNDCECRKPKTGMIMNAVRDFDVDPKESFVVGDRMVDVQTGIAVGARSILVMTGYGREELELCRKSGVAIDHVADNLYEAMQFIKHTVNESRPSIRA